MLVVGDAALIPLPDESVHCVVTSPPYWGLRKYEGVQGIGRFPNLGLEQTPDEYLDHMVTIFREVWRVLRQDGVVFLNIGDTFASSWASGRRNIIGNPSRTNRVDRTTETIYKEGDLCMIPQRLAIALQQDGWLIRRDLIWHKLNPMPESVSGWRWERHRIKVDREDVDWKSRPKGWQAGLGTHDSGSDSKGQYRHDDEQTRPVWIDCPGCEKCLHDNPLFPDLYVLKFGSWRHTTSHEYVWMMTKQMKYHCNQELVREALQPDTLKRESYGWNAAFLGRHQGSPTDKRLHSDDHYNFSNPSGRNPRSVEDINDFDLEELWHLFLESMTNPADVLQLPTVPYPGAHYAVYTPNLIAPLIRAACPKYCCPECGQAWAPVIDPQGYRKHRPSAGNDPRSKSEDKQALGSLVGHHGWRGNNLLKNSPVVVDYRPTCDCGCETSIPGIVLDPFAGTGTTGMVAKEIGRRWIAMDISEPYMDEQARLRTKWGKQKTQVDDLPLFNHSSRNEK